VSLKKDIEKLTEQSIENIPKETLSVMVADTERLRKSGIVDNSLKAGDTAPFFSLPNVRGEQISSADLLSKGPLVLSFYRGGW
jgi:hypothetical protein